MTIRRRCPVIVITLVLFLSAFAPDSSSAYTMSELLRYDLTWSGIKAGEAVLELKDNGQEAQIISRANSTAFVSMFYRVEDVVIATLRKGQSLVAGFWGVPRNYRLKTREGKQRKDKETIFDPSGRKATFINHLEPEKVDFDLDLPALDPLSCFYYIRGLPLEVGKSVYVAVFDSKKLYKAEIQVLKKEIIETSLGRFNTILIRPVMKSEGIFSRRGDILIWLTDDDKRIPVLLKTKLSVGSVKATLTGGKY
ncbi:MAG: DUF3108 domain-containing protein [Thermodesulfovibrionales bacterium]